MNVPSKQSDNFEEEQRQLNGICHALLQDANASAVLVIDKNGQELATAGEVENLDITSLATLAAGNVAATGGIASLLAEDEFSGQFHEGEKISIHISIIKRRLILLVLFDQRSSLGLVRLRVKKANLKLASVLEAMDAHPPEGSAATILEDLTDDDIDSLFSD